MTLKEKWKENQKERRQTVYYMREYIIIYMVIADTIMMQLAWRQNSL